jgi:hypothetical protein
VLQNRRFNRLRMSGPAAKGTIIVDPKAPAIPCRVVDLSAGGACLEVVGQMPIPKRFVLLHGGIKKNCSLVWTAGQRFGVLF